MSWAVCRVGYQSTKRDKTCAKWLVIAAIDTLHIPVPSRRKPVLSSSKERSFENRRPMGAERFLDAEVL